MDVMLGRWCLGWSVVVLSACARSAAPTPAPPLPLPLPLPTPTPTPTVADSVTPGSPHQVLRIARACLVRDRRSVALVRLSSIGGRHWRVELAGEPDPDPSLGPADVQPDPPGMLDIDTVASTCNGVVIAQPAMAASDTPFARLLQLAARCASEPLDATRARVSIELGQVPRIDVNPTPGVFDGTHYELDPASGACSAEHGWSAGASRPGPAGHHAIVLR